MEKEQIISKGVYNFSQISDFISVKNYIFMHQDEKICLAIRFSNDTDYVIDSVAFCLIRLDAAGKVIGKKRVEYTGMNLFPGELYCANKGIVVENQCVDFKIQFYEAYSGYYKYVVRNRRVNVYYDRKTAERMMPPPKREEEPSLLVEKKEYGRPKLSVLAAILALLIMAGFNIYYLYSLYADTFPDKNEKTTQVLSCTQNGEESLYFGVEYAEI